jgi:hypothetical protein
MSDHSGATIEIGGEIFIRHFALLAKAADRDGFCGEQEVTFKMAQQCAMRGEPLKLEALTARSGVLEAIEPFCQAYGLTYRRISEGYHEWDAYLVMWAPGMKAGSVSQIRRGAPQST